MDVCLKYGAKFEVNRILFVFTDWHSRISQLEINIDIFYLPRIFIRRDLTCCCVKRHNESTF